MELNEKTPKIRAVDLFCGAGGLTHGLARAGIDVVAGIDIDPACRYPYETNNRSRFIECDVNAVTNDEITAMIQGADFSLIAGCAPCQPFSSYRRSTLKKTPAHQWDLVLTFGKLVQRVQPDLVTMENVPQLLEHPVFAQFLKCLQGYAVNWAVVHVDRVGVPQTRKRLVLLASRLGSKSLEIEQNYAPAQTVRDAIGQLRPVRAGESNPYDSLHVAPRLSDINLERIRHSTPGGTWRDWPEKLQAACHKKRTGSTYPSVYGRMSWSEPAPTITTQCFGYGNGRFGHPEQDRAISLREAALLQTFPAHYKFVPDGQSVRFAVLGRLIGNAVPVRLGQAIGQSLITHVAQTETA